RTRANPRVAARIRRREKGRGCVRPGRTPSPSPSSLRLVLLAAAVLAALEASEPAHGDVFAQGRDLLLNQIPDLPIRVFDERLLQQADFLEVLLQPPGHDLVRDVLGLALVEGGLPQDALLLLDHALRHVVPGDVERTR